MSEENDVEQYLRDGKVYIFGYGYSFERLDLLQIQLPHQDCWFQVFDLATIISFCFTTLCFCKWMDSKILARFGGFHSLQMCNCD
jgi:hypothetical protein